jgi:predicted Holliday junction resolvase-like endonuclease
MKIRNDAKFRSYSTLKGKSAENLLPFYRNFPFNSQDTRFVGSPIDLIIFDGLSEPEREIDIYIVEIKTGGSKLSKNQLRVKDAAENRRIIWRQINAEDLQIDLVKI